MNTIPVIDGAFKCIIMGPPGAGKGTIAGRILRHFPMVHISCGDHIRAHIRRKTGKYALYRTFNRYKAVFLEFGLEAQGFIRRGALVPDRLISEIMASELLHHAGENWLLDGNTHISRHRHGTACGASKPAIAAANVLP